MVGGLGDCLIIICSKEWSTRSGSGITGILIRTVDPLGPSLSIGLPVTTSLLKQHRRYAQNDRHSNLFIGGFGTWIAHDVACKRGFTKLICFKVQVISVYIYILVQGYHLFLKPNKTRNRWCQGTCVRARSQWRLLSSRCQTASCSKAHARAWWALFVKALSHLS